MIYIFGTSLIYIILIAIIYFSKGRVDNYDNKFYSIIILINIIGVAIDIIQSLFIRFEVNDIMINFISKLFLIYIVIWTFLFCSYILSLSTKKLQNNILKKIRYIPLIFGVVGTFIFPINYYHDGSNMYTYGTSVNLIYGIVCLYIIIMIISCFSNLYNNKKYIKKYIPLLIFLLTGTVTLITQYINPSILLTSPCETLVTILTYFFIENPDKKMIEQLNIARDQAEKANRAKSDFLSNMSHEIRTPLNAIVGFSQALQEEDLPDSAKDEVSDIVSASNSLLELVNGILDISKIEADKLEIVNTEYSFKNVYNDLVALTRARMGEKPLDLRLSYDESIPSVLYGDHTRIKQIILNLLTNAVKYTREGYVSFKVSSVIEGDVCRLIVSVEDSGIGIKNENIDKLFMKFERFDLDKNITIEGTGLGLAITKKLVDLMHGKIVVQSVYGKGSKFTVALDQKIIRGKEVVLESHEAKVELFEAPDKKILVVDDNKINLKVAARLLSNYKVNVELVESGFECLEKVKTNTYDLILMDDMMPKMSGVETFHKLKENNSFNTPVVALTANAITGMKEKYLSEGFNDYLSKPIDKLELNIIMKKYLKK